MNRIEKNWNRIFMILAAAAAGIIAFLICRQLGFREERLAQQKLAGEVMRFHVLANSDRREDQELKLKVRDEVLDYLRENMPHAEADTTSMWIRKHTREIEKTARKCVAEQGYDYPVNAAVTTCWYSDRMMDYGQGKKCLFPEGNYEALRVEIGLGRGHNWWGILYPELGFLHTTRAVYEEKRFTETAGHESRPEKTESGIKELTEDVLTEEEGTEITATTTFKLRSYFLEKLKR